MKKHSLFFIFSLLIISACAHSKVIPFTSENGKIVSYPPTRTEDVGIYRSAHPFSAFTELGLITLRAYQ
jgi:hypothetical protein